LITNKLGLPLTVNCNYVRIDFEWVRWFVNDHESNTQIYRDRCTCVVVWACAYTKYFKFLFLSNII